MIYVMTHKPCNLAVADTDYARLQVGAALHEPLPYFRDDRGDEISAKNESYCELTGMYYVWKNRRDDYVGICHYRRYFLDEKGNILTGEKAREWLKQYDVLVSPMVSVPEEVKSLSEDYERIHIGADFTVARQVIYEQFPEYKEAFDCMAEDTEFCVGNMMICRKEVYDCYCEWLFAVLEQCEKHICISNRDTYQKRVFGFLAERLLNVYLKKHSEYRVANVNVAVLTEEMLDSFGRVEDSKMPRVSLYVMTHKPFVLPAMADSCVYQPLHVGGEGKPDFGYQKDNTGDNISGKNANYCELTGLYWVWKNVVPLGDGYFGLSHYRRYLLDERDRILNRKEIVTRLSQADMIVSNAQHCRPEAESVLEFYDKYHYAEDLITTGEVIGELYPAYRPAFEEVMVGNYFYGGNLFVCRRELFSRYMEWLFSVLAEVEKRIDISGYNDYQKRVFGFLAERLLLVYIRANNLIVWECEVGEVAQEDLEPPKGKIQRILVYKLISQYNALRVFADEMIAVWRKLGIAVDVVGEDVEHAQEELERVLGNRYDALFAMNGVLSDVKLPDGRILQDTFQAPYYAYYVDHPYFNHQRIVQPLQNYHGICVEETFATYMREYYPNLKTVDVMPQAGIEGENSTRPFEERKIPLVFLGTYRGHETVMEEILQQSGVLKRILLSMVQRGKANPDLTLEELLGQTLEELSISLSKGEFANILSSCKLADTYLRAYFREEAVKAIVQAGIPIEVYGTGWEQLDCPHRELLHCHPPVDYREFLDVLADAKMVLNVLPWAKAGFHDRIACTMLNGAVSVSDESTYLKRELKDGKEIVLYSLKELHRLPERIRYYLEREQEAAQIAAAGYAYAKKRHTWENRAMQVLQMMERDIADQCIAPVEEPGIWQTWQQEYEKRGYRFYMPHDNEGQKKSKKILLITHQLSRSGAPYALYTMAQQLRKEYQIVVLTVEPGELLEDYLNAGILVVEAGKYWNRKFVFKGFAKQFDAVVANTVLNFPAVMLLDGLSLPVFWWIHEHENYFSYGRGEIPDPKGFHDNVHVLAAGRYVQQVIEWEFAYTPHILNIGVPDVTEEERAPMQTKRQGNDMEAIEMLHFLVVGPYGREKGQDIVVDAYMQLTEEERKRISLTFVGSTEEKDDAVYNQVKKLAEQEDTIFLREPMSRRELFSLYCQADGVVIASRQETLSMVAVENMMFSKCVVASSGAGISYYIEDGENGFCFANEDSGALAECLRQLLCENNLFLEQLGEKARKVYEEYFSMEVWTEELKNNIKKYL